MADGALSVLLVTGALMVLGEPARELLAFSFWLKMGLIAFGTFVAAAFRVTLRNNQRRWETTIVNRGSTRSLAILMLGSG